MKKIFLALHRCDGNKGLDGVFFLADGGGNVVYEGLECDCKDWAKANGFGIRREA